MINQTINGVIDQSHIDRKTDYLYRISIKGLIKNEHGKVLVVKETGRTWWDLPGGGMDHSETIKEAITRELAEEVNLIGEFTYEIIAVEDPSYLQHANVWQIRMIFAVAPESMDFSAGEDGDAVTFIDPIQLKNSDNAAERKVYEYSQSH